MSVYDDMAFAAGYLDDEAAQVARMLEERDREDHELLVAEFEELQRQEYYDRSLWAADDDW